MSAGALLAVTGVAAGAAGIAALVVPPTTRLGPRVRPYAAVARSALGHRDATAVVRLARRPSGVLARLFGPPLLALAARAGRSMEQRGDDQLLRLLRQSGTTDQTPDEYRVRQLGEAFALAALSGVAVAVLIRTPIAALLGSVAGFVVGLAMLAALPRFAAPCLIGDGEALVVEHR